MKLYHFTFIAHLPAMLGAELIDGPAEGERGIVPSTNGGINGGGGEFMSGGKPVVWLTSRDSLMPTPADLAWSAILQAQGNFTKDEAEHYTKFGSMGDRTVRVAVELRNSRRLRHYGTWLRETGMDAVWASLSPSSALTDWWIYFGTVQRRRIVEITRTDAPHVNDCERDLWLAMEASFQQVAA
jgi:hypothetical protein